MIHNEYIDVVVTIDPVNTINTDYPAIGLYGGVFRWGDTGDEANTKYGVLAKKWLSTITASLDIRRSGNYTALNGSTIKISNNFGLLAWLKSANISLYKGVVKVEAVYRYEDIYGTEQVLQKTLYTGQVLSVDPALDFITIKTEAVDRGYDTPPAELVTDTDICRPVFIGGDTVEHTKGIYIEQEPKDIEALGYQDRELPNLLYRVVYSDLYTVKIKPTTMLLITEDFSGIRDALNNIITDVDGGVAVITAVDGDGVGVSFPFYGAQVNWAGTNGADSTIELTLGYQNNGTVYAGTYNKMPDGLVGDEVNIWGTTEPVTNYPDLEVSIVKLQEAVSVVAMDGWDNTEDTYKGEASIWVDGGYVPAPSYGASIINSGSDMKIVGDKGDGVLDIANTVGTGEKLPLVFAVPADLKDLDNTVFSGTPLADWGVFGDIYTNYDESGVWVKDGYSTTHDIQDSQAQLSAMIKNNTTSGVGEFKSFLSMGIPDTLSFVYKMGMPKKMGSFKDVALTLNMVMQMKATLSDNADYMKMCTYIMVNDGKGLGASSWRVVSSVHFNYNTDMSGSTDPTRQWIQNIYPPLEDNHITAQQLYDYLPNYVDGSGNVDRRLANHKSILPLDFTEIERDSIGEFFLVFGVHKGGSSLSNISEANLTIESMAVVGAADIDPEAITFTYSGRAYNETDRTIPMQDMGHLYHHFCRLQNFTSYGVDKVPKPVNGWGSSYPAITDLELEKYVDPDIKNITTPSTLQGQIVEAGNISTKWLKRELLKTGWGIGYTSTDGVERYKEIDLSSTGTTITYRDLKGAFSYKTRQIEDIFTEGTFKFRYEKGADTYLATIAILKVDEVAYQDGYVLVTGFDTEPTTLEKQEMWQYAHTLYMGYNTVNKIPDTVTHVPLISGLTDAIGYVNKLYKYQGAHKDTGGAYTLYDRYTLRCTVGMDFYLKQGLGMAESINLEIPHFSDPLDPHTGVITGFSSTFTDKSTVAITAEMQGNIMAGGDTLGDLLRTGSTADNTLEDGSRADNYLRDGV